MQRLDLVSNNEKFNQYKIKLNTLISGASQKNEVKLGDVSKTNLESPKMPKKFEMDRLSKFINLNTVDMKKLKGGRTGGVNFSDLLDDVTFIDPGKK